MYSSVTLDLNETQTDSERYDAMVLGNIEAYQPMAKPEPKNPLENLDKADIIRVYELLLDNGVKRIQQLEKENKKLKEQLRLPTKKQNFESYHN